LAKEGDMTWRPTQSDMRRAFSCHRNVCDMLHSCTHNCVLAEVAWRPLTAGVVQEYHVVAQIGAVGQTAEGHERSPGQEGIHRTCGHSAPCEEPAALPTHMHHACVRLSAWGLEWPRVKPVLTEALRSLPVTIQLRTTRHRYQTDTA
jgi:hypothetical protein